MNGPDDTRRELQAARARIAALSAAILRTSASLDLTTVLQEAVDTARALTAARYGIITTVDEAGGVRDFVSSGFTEAEHRQFLEWPDGPKLFAHLRDLPGPVRLTDLPALVRSLGFSPDLMRSKTFQGTPMRHRGETVGHFFLAEKEGESTFTDEDEEVLVLFASQAATAIANARSPPRRAARAGRPRGAGRDFAGRRRWCSMPAPAVRCRSTARRGASSRGCVPPDRARGGAARGS